MTQHATTVVRRVAPLCVAALVVWSVAPAFGLGLGAQAMTHETGSLLLFGGALFGCAGAVRRR
jgi:hypothetical protein